MKVIIEIDDYILDTDIDSDWVNVCNDELAESLNNAVKFSDVLQEIRQEIAGLRDDAESRYGHLLLGFDKIYAYERCIDLIDGKIKELSE